MLAFPYDKLEELVALATKWMESPGENETLFLALVKGPGGVRFIVAPNFL